MTAPDDSRTGMTIDELSDRTGMSVRNIRAHQTRGLVEPPKVLGRIGYYDEDHASRIDLIKELQGEGYNLEAIKLILRNAGDSPGDLISFNRTVRAPYQTEEPQIFETDEIARLWGGELPQADLMARFEQIGLMRPLGEGRHEVLSPKMLNAGLKLTEMGITPEVALDALETIKQRSDKVAEFIVDLFNEEVWDPFDRDGRPRDEWPRVQAAIDQTRSLAPEAVLAAFQIAMEEASIKSISDAIRRDLKAPDEN